MTQISSLPNHINLKSQKTQHKNFVDMVDTLAHNTIPSSPSSEIKNDIIIQNEKDTEERKKLKREAKALKKLKRERQRIENTMRLDKRPEVRMAAMVELKLSSTDSENDTKNANINIETAVKESGCQRQQEHGDASFLEAAEYESQSQSQSEERRVISLMDMSLTDFSISSLITHKFSPASIVELDVSHNQLSELPGLAALTNLVSLDMRRNEFRSLPGSLSQLSSLVHLNASRNQLRSSAALLVLLTKPPLPSIQTIDLTFNKKLFTQSLLDLLTSSLPSSVAIYMTVTSPPPPGAYIGDSPGERDASQLRSQLEPFTTLQLRKRLVHTFGHAPYSMYGEPPQGRAQVMTLLLEEYAKRANEINISASAAVLVGSIDIPARICTSSQRKLVRSWGTPVPMSVLAEVGRELEAWSRRYDAYQERPMIRASQYMILRSPSEAEEKIIRMGSRRAGSAIRKYQQNKSLWDAAKAAMETVDQDFSRAFTGLAVTRGFIGSPHIDTTNIGPFYGLSWGDFEDGTGGVRVELDPLTVCEVNTKNRLGRIDGRFPHWVAPYDEEKNRYSLIFYLTEGKVQPKTKAVFGEIVADDED